MAAKKKVMKFKSAYAVHTPDGEDFIVMLTESGTRASIFFNNLAGGRKRADVRGAFPRDTIVETLRFIAASVNARVSTALSVNEQIKLLKESVAGVVVLDPMGVLDVDE